MFLKFFEGGVKTSFLQSILDVRQQCRHRLVGLLVDLSEEPTFVGDDLLEHQKCTADFGCHHFDKWLTKIGVHPIQLLLLFLLCSNF